MERSDGNQGKAADVHPTLGLNGIFGLLKETLNSWSAHRVPKMGAALSYYMAFSLAPLVVLILSVGSLAVQREVARQEILSEVTDLMGPQAATAVQEILNHPASKTTASWGTVVSFLVLLIGASGAFGELQDSLNQIWEVPPQKHPFLHMLKDRALSFAMVFVLGFFMIVSLTVSALIANLSHLTTNQFPAICWELVNAMLSFLVFSALFGVIFRMLPDVHLKWRDVWHGAVFSSILFIIGKLLLGWYIGRSTFFSSYGAAGSFVVILVWVFYSSQILFLGAEFTRAYTRHYGSHRGKSEEEMRTPPTSTF